MSKDAEQERGHEIKGNIFDHRENKDSTNPNFTQNMQNEINDWYFYRDDQKDTLFVKGKVHDLPHIEIVHGFENLNNGIESRSIGNNKVQGIRNNLWNNATNNNQGNPIGNYLKNEKEFTIIIWI